MGTGQVNISYKKRRIAYDDSEKLVGQAIHFLPAPELKDKIAKTAINTLVE